MLTYTEHLDNILSKTINQLELFSIVASEEVDIGIIAWFNNNEGFVAFLGVIASFVVSVTAIVISVLTYRSQKKEQTKNAQESAKLQRELTEQQNKFQAELQVRQIKLDSFNLRYECWNILQYLDSLFAIYKKRISLYKENYNESCIGELLEVNNTVKKIFKVEDVRLLLKMKFILKDKKEVVEQIVNDSEMIETILILNSKQEEYMPDVLYLIEEKIQIIKAVNMLLYELEKDLDISELHKIPKNSYSL